MWEGRKRGKEEGRGERNIHCWNRLIQHHLVHTVLLQHHTFLLKQIINKGGEQREGERVRG